MSVPPNLPQHAKHYSKTQSLQPAPYICDEQNCNRFPIFFKLRPIKVTTPKSSYPHLRLNRYRFPTFVIPLLRIPVVPQPKSETHFTTTPNATINAARTVFLSSQYSPSSRCLYLFRTIPPAPLLSFRTSSQQYLYSFLTVSFSGSYNSTEAFQ